MSPSITVVGSINADLSARVARHPSPGETLLGEGGEVSAGGKGANQAVAAALLGADVAFVGAVGSDPYAEPATELLRAAGVDMENVEKLPGATGLAIITLSEDGENTIIVIPGANTAVDAEFVAKHRDPIEKAQILVLQGEIPASGFAEAVRLATGQVVVNLAPVIEVDPEALKRANPLVANEHEAGLILDNLGVGHAGKDEAAMARLLLEAGFASVVLTLGARGALVAEAGEVIEISTPKVTPVDTTGAGDAFTGALAARLAAGDSLVEAARFAARVGAFATTSHGAQASYPTAEDTLPEVTE